MNLDERARRAAASVRQEAGQVDTDAMLDRVQGTTGSRRWWVPAVAATAAAVAVIVAVGLVLPQLRADRIEIGPDPVVPGDPDPSPSETRTDGSEGTPAVGTWQRVESETFALGGDSRMRAVAHVGGTTIAVGRSSGRPGIWRQDPQRPPEDAVGWRQVAGDLCGEASCEVHDVVTFGGRFVVVGTLDGLPKVWASGDDGQSWQRVDIDRAPGRQPDGETVLTAVAAHAGGLVAFGTEGDGRPVVFTSADGMGWTEAPVDFDSEEAGARVVDAAHVGGGRVVAVGYVGDGAVLWDRQNGRWIPRFLGEADPEFNVVTTFANSLDVGPDGELLLAGSARGDRDQDGRVWRSTDGGATWEPMAGDLGGSADQHVTDVFTAGGAWIAVGWTTDEPQSNDPRPAAWILGEDGWEPMDRNGAFDAPGAIIAAVATNGHSAIAVGIATGNPYDLGGGPPADASAWAYAVADGPAASTSEVAGG